MNMDNDSRLADANPNSVENNNDGGFAASANPKPPVNDANPTTPDEIKKKHVASALATAKSVVEANAVELQEKYLTDAILPILTVFLTELFQGVKQQTQRGENIATSLAICPAQSLHYQRSIYTLMVMRSLRRLRSF